MELQKKELIMIKNELKEINNLLKKQIKFLSAKKDKTKILLSRIDNLL
tara:strand:- start:181 stop:324 length:144 start_codon:yes stop_codon:yes gene_type:complete